MCVCVCVSPDVVAERLWTVDAAVRPGWLPVRPAVCDGALGRAVIKVLHHDDQFTTEVVRRRFRLVLDLRAAGGEGGRDGAGEPDRYKDTRRSVGPLDWRGDFSLKETHRKWIHV